MKQSTPVLSPAHHLVTLMLRVRPSFVNRMRVIAHDLRTSSREEDGCLFYFAAESRETEGFFLIMSAWRDRDAYDLHRKSPYVRAFESQIAPELLRESATLWSWKKIG
jgi:quinol monooxygenase YgiN